MKEEGGRMKDEIENKDERGGQSSSSTGNQSGDPGRTPGAAEGDRETVEQDLGEKKGKDEVGRVRDEE